MAWRAMSPPSHHRGQPHVASRLACSMRVWPMWIAAGGFGLDPAVGRPAAPAPTRIVVEALVTAGPASPRRSR